MEEEILDFLQDYEISLMPLSHEEHTVLWKGYQRKWVSKTKMYQAGHKTKILLF